MNEETSEARQSYEVVSIKRADPPHGLEGANWYHYVISFGGNDNIQGYRHGSLKVVTDAVDDVVSQLNDRHRGKHGRVHLVPTPKKVAPAPPAVQSKSK